MSIGWIWGVTAVVGGFISLFGAVIVHLRAYDLQKRVENLEDRQQSIRSRVYSELSKGRDEVLHEVESYLQEREGRETTGGTDIGQAILMHMLSGGMNGPQQPEPADNIDAIDQMLIGSGGDGDN